MKSLIKKIVHKLQTELLTRLDNVEQATLANRFLLGSMAARQLREQIKNNHIKTLQEVEFQVFSQFGDDGIIQYLVEKLKPLPEIFIEFGVESYKEANTRFLLMHNNWRGLIIDGDANLMAAVRRSDLCWRYDLTAVGAFITRENINDIFVKNGFAGEIGLLSIDIDGNDYWVWQAIEAVNPVIVIAEYNSVFGAERAISIPYRPDFHRHQAHYSGLYWGASLPAFCHLAEQKGYDFVGCNSAGNNAYFIRKDRNPLPPLTAREGFVGSRFRESRDAAGNLTFLSGETRLAAIRGCEVVEVKSNQIFDL
ncbi:hypothetical protein [Rhodoflexus caldus]|uniref:hypothetical protein n=1 Tax=Rhodoflexus caldus TaxID=2891236 RepID=UPI00202AA71F|nr:hypothetical protein [Rhodoflexus caldus]